MRNKVVKTLRKLASDGVLASVPGLEGRIGRQVTKDEVRLAIKKTLKLYKRLVRRVPRNKKGA